MYWLRLCNWNTFASISMEIKWKRRNEKIYKKKTKITKSFHFFFSSTSTMTIETNTICAIKVRLNSFQTLLFYRDIYVYIVLKPIMCTLCSATINHTEKTRWKVWATNYYVIRMRVKKRIFYMVNWFSILCINGICMCMFVWTRIAILSF